MGCLICGCYLDKNKGDNWWTCKKCDDKVISDYEKLVEKEKQKTPFFKGYRPNFYFNTEKQWYVIREGGVLIWKEHFLC